MSNATVKLFDIQNGKVMPTEHCFTNKSLSIIMDRYKDYLEVYTFIFYMSCKDPSLNPYFNVEEEEREDLILAEVGGDFNPDDEEIQSAIYFCQKLYQTPIFRLFEGAKYMIERIAKYLKTQEIIEGKEGNAAFIQTAMKNLDEYSRSFLKAQATYLEEINAGSVRGGQDLAYDSDQNDDDDAL